MSHPTTTRRRRAFLAFCAAVAFFAAFFAASSDAHATDDDGIALTPSTTLVAWLITADGDDVWGDGQTYVTHLELAEPSLDALDAAISDHGCGRYQVDLYWTGEVTDALIAGGILYGPGNPREDLAYGAVEGNPWKFVTVETCPEVEPTPEPTPTEAPPTSTPEPTEEPTPTPVPTVTPQPTPTETTVVPVPTSSAPPVVVEIAQPVTGTPQLAATGASPGAGFLVGLVVVVFGTTLVAIARRRRPRS